MLEGLWINFVAGVDDAGDFETVRKLHEKYLDDVIECCLLHPKVKIIDDRVDIRVDPRCDVLHQKDFGFMSPVPSYVRQDPGLR